MNIIEQDLSRKIGENYKFGAREHSELLSIIESWHSDSIDQQHKRMQRLLSQAKQVPDSNLSRASYKTGEVISLLRSKTGIKSLLDLGAGSGDITRELARSFKLPKDKVWALTVSLRPSTSVYTSITYQEGAIDLPAGSVDLVLIAQVLHHIHPDERRRILLEVKKVLSPTGTVVIQEHNFMGDLQTYIALDILHTYWYVKKEEKVDGLYLMSEKQTSSLFSSVGMKMQNKIPAKRWQWTYWATYVIGTSEQVMTEQEYLSSPSYLEMITERQSISSALQKFDPISLYLCSWNKSMPYHSRQVTQLGSQAVKWGQLKLFLGILQALLDFWDPVLVPNLIVVYAGAAPGRSFDLLLSMFPTITWHLYDAKRVVVPEVPGRLTFYKQYFEDKEARLWSQHDNVFFMSDIRRFGVKDYEGVKLEETIIEDMANQAKWVTMMNPYRASLKLRAPYLLDVLPSGADQYLEGNVMLQSFNSPTSAETRLIPIRDRETGLYYMKKWDWKKYEDQMFYHNAIIREQAVYSYPGSPDGIVSDVSGLDNHFDSIHLLIVLDKYRASKPRYQVGSSSVPLAREVMRSLSKYSDRGQLTISTERAAEEQRRQS